MINSGKKLKFFGPYEYCLFDECTILLGKKVVSRASLRFKLHSESENIVRITKLAVNYRDVDREHVSINSLSTSQQLFFRK